MKHTCIYLLTAVLAGYWINLNGQSTPRQGEILITEIMVNPEAVSDANGEWFEIWNATDHELILNGMILTDAGSNRHVITSPVSLLIPAKAYWVLAKNADILTNGGVTVNYAFQNFTLSNTSDQIIITGANETLIDQVSYGSDWPVISGASMELQPDQLSFAGNDQPEHWFPATVPFGAGDKGSPGRANPVMSGLEEWEQGLQVDIYPNPSPGRFVVEAAFLRPESGEIRMTNLSGQEFLYTTFSNRDILREEVDCDFLTPGIWFVSVKAGNRTRTTRLFIEK